MARRPKAAADAPAELAPDTAAADVVRSVADATHMPAEAMADDQSVAADRKRAYQPDPFLQQTIKLGGGDDAPRMRLFRNGRKGEVAITFDDKPGPDHITALRDAGFRWQAGDKAWTKPIDRDERWRAQADAEKVFNAIGTAIREEKGLGESRDVPI